MPAPASVLESRIHDLLPELEIPTNHHPGFAPVLHPTLETGVAAMVVASHAWLAR